MDTYEENNLTLQPEPEEQVSAELNITEEAQSIQPEASEIIPEENPDGFYHGAGTGIREETGAKDIEPEIQQESLHEAELARKALRKQKRKMRGKKVLKCTVAAVLVLAMVLTGCGISIVAMNRHWEYYNQLLIQNFEDQIAVLRDELEEIKTGISSNPVPPNSGMTPTQIYNRNINSIVAINCIIRTTVGGKIQEAGTAGSGFVLDKNGYIVTNYHVIEGATLINVVFANGESMAAKLIGGDAIHDVALIKVEATNLQSVTIGSSDALRVGDQVVAIGNALGELSFSLTVGYISGTDRRIATDGSITHMLQTDASINSGNSGGPLFNSKGEVIGITTAKYSGVSSSGASIEGVGFALPIDDVIGMLDDLRQYGYITGAHLGVMVRDMDPAVAETYGFPMGAYVLETTPGAAADRAGIQAKDIIVTLGGYHISCMSDLTRALRNFQAGQKTQVVVFRAGQRIVLNIVFDEKPRG